MLSLLSLILSLYPSPSVFIIICAVVWWFPLRSAESLSRSLFMIVLSYPQKVIDFLAAVVVAKVGREPVWSIDQLAIRSDGRSINIQNEGPESPDEESVGGRKNILGHTICPPPAVFPRRGFCHQFSPSSFFSFYHSYCCRDRPR